MTHIDSSFFYFCFDVLSTIVMFQKIIDLQYTVVLNSGSFCGVIIKTDVEALLLLTTSISITYLIYLCYVFYMYGKF